MTDLHLNALSVETEQWLKTTTVERRKSLGQYMTPRALRERLLDQCEFRPGMRVLDPGVGTGEFLRSVIEREPSAETVGWDVDPLILRAARDLVPQAELVERSALDPYFGGQFDLVVGNPPYFQFGAAQEIRDYFARVISGRVNIFALFFQVGLEALRDGGQLAFVVPPSMNSGAYFERLREFIVERCAVEYLEIFTDQNLFDGAQTPVQLLVLRLGKRDDGRHTITHVNPRNGFRRTTFSEQPDLIADSLKSGESLHDLGYEAVTGSIVWNQHKTSLRTEPTPSSVPLIWAHNIADGNISLTPGHAKKPQYIDKPSTTLIGPAIVVNRIIGAVGQGTVRCALVPEGLEFVGENHVNVIRAHGKSHPQVSWPALLTALRRPEVAERARLVTGNTQLSATELTHLVPLTAEG